MRLTESAQGVYPIAPTPFFDDGRIDTASIDRLVDFYLGIGATGLTVLGQLGEASKLGTGAGVGAIIGGILGGVKGAIAGVLIGGGGMVAATEGKDVQIPAGTVLRVRFDAPVTVGS